MTYRVIIGERAKPVAARIKTEGDPGIKAAYGWLLDHLQLEAGGLGTAIPGAKDNARAAGVGDVLGIWTLPGGGNIAILRVLQILTWPETITPYRPDID